MSETLCTCKVCGATFPRRSPRGPIPTLCDEHKDPTRNKYRTSGKGRPLSNLEQEAEAARAAARQIKVEEEPTWLDDPAVQEQLAERQRIALGLDASASAGDVIEEVERRVGEGEPVPVEVLGCAAPTCTTPPAHPQAEPKFCLNHWLRLSHDLRGILLTEPGTSPWNGALVRAIRSLR